MYRNGPITWQANFIFQIPQSYPLKQTVEPSYASRIQTNPVYSNVPQQDAQSHYSNTPTLPINSKMYHCQQPDNNYVNFPRDSDTASQYSNLPRSASAMSNTSSIPRQGKQYICGFNISNHMLIFFSGNIPVSYGSRNVHQGNLLQGHGSDYSPKSCSLPRQVMGPKAYTKPDQVTYSNVHVGQRNQEGLLYSNLMHPSRDGGNIYSNMRGNTNAYANGGNF